MKRQANKLGYCLLNMHLDLQKQETLLVMNSSEQRVGLYAGYLDFVD